MTNVPDRSTTAAPAGIAVVRPPNAVIRSPSITITASGTAVPATTSMTVAPLSAVRAGAGACCDDTPLLESAPATAVDATRRVSVFMTLLRRKREQHIARQDAAVVRIARIHEEHAADDRGPGIAHRAAVRFHAVDRGELPRSVVFPEDLAVAGRIGAQPAVHRAGEDGAGKERDGGVLRRLAGLLVGAARARNAPDEPACLHIDGVHAAARFGFVGEEI